MKKTFKTISAIMGIIAGIGLIGNSYEGATLGEFLIIELTLLAVVLFSLHVCCYKDKEAENEVI